MKSLGHWGSISPGKGMQTLGQGKLSCEFRGRKIAFHKRWGRGGSAFELGLEKGLDLVMCILKTLPLHRPASVQPSKCRLWNVGFSSSYILFNDLLLHSMLLLLSQLRPCSLSLTHSSHPLYSLTWHSSPSLSYALLPELFKAVSSSFSHHCTFPDQPSPPCPRTLHPTTILSVLSSTHHQSKQS